MSEPLRCPVCGATLSPGQTECTSCGETTPQQEAPGRFRWRFIPTALLAIFGGFGLLGGVLMFVMSVAAIAFPLRRAPISHLLGMGMISVCWGTLWLLAAHWCWNRRWLRFVLAFAGGYAVMGLATWFLPP